MAVTIVPNVCPYCKGKIDAGEPVFLCGLDMSGWPDTPPVSVYAHRACWQASRATVILPAAAEPGRAAAVQGSLFPTANNALAAGGDHV